MCCGREGTGGLVRRKESDECNCDGSIDFLRAGSVEDVGEVIILRCIRWERLTGRGWLKNFGS